MFVDRVPTEEGRRTPGPSRASAAPSGANGSVCHCNSRHHGNATKSNRVCGSSAAGVRHGALLPVLPRLDTLP